MKHPTLIALFALALVPLTNCAATHLGILEAPHISLINVTPKDVTLFEQRYDVTLRIQNPNDVTLPMKGIKFDLALNGNTFARGLKNQTLRIPSLGEDTMTVTVTSTALDWISLVKGMQSGNATGLNYDLNGTVYLTGVTGMVKNLKFNRSGTLGSGLMAPSP